MTTTAYHAVNYDRKKRLQGGLLTALYKRLIALNWTKKVITAKRSSLIRIFVRGVDHRDHVHIERAWVRSNTGTALQHDGFTRFS